MIPTTLVLRHVLLQQTGRSTRLRSFTSIGALGSNGARCLLLVETFFFCSSPDARGDLLPAIGGRSTIPIPLPDLRFLTSKSHAVRSLTSCVGVRSD